VRGFGKKKPVRQDIKRDKEAGMATSRSLTLVPAVCIALLISLLPAAGQTQQPEQPPVAPPLENAAPEASQQKPAETAPERQQGNVVIPAQGEPAPEKAETAPQAAPQEAKEAAKKEEGETYTIKKGDTLWDISNAFLKDPFLWPFIWKANQYITNPDLIYPGNNLVIPSLAPIERALQAQPKPKEQLAEKQAPTAEAQAKPEQAEAKKLLVPEEKPVPVMDSHSMLRAGFVMTDEFANERRDRITDSRDGKTVLSYDDVVYVYLPSKPEAAVGDKFIIYRKLNAVIHPVTGRVFGNLAKVLGVLQLTEKGRAPGYFTARITLSFDAAGVGSLLTPYQEPSLVYRPARAENMGKDITGYIIAVLDERTVNSQTDIVYLDKGSADGVEPGDRFVIYGPSLSKNYAPTVVGEAQAFLVKENTSTAVIRKSSNYIARGYKVEYLK
jgi:LysM repeat protein